MKNPDQKQQAFKEALHLQSMEDNSLDEVDKEMFEMFERENWSPERRRAYILKQAKANTLTPAAE